MEQVSGRAGLRFPGAAESGTSIHRLTGDGGRDLIAPLWSVAKFEVLNAIDDELELRGTRQGSRV